MLNIMHQNHFIYEGDILRELKFSNSRIRVMSKRVIFVTTALGMGGNVPRVTNIIHISPSSKLESYVQEIRHREKCCTIKSHIILQQI